ncbi:Exosome component EXOSC1/CSL4 [Ceratobasidium sp. AG-Ba]|nr:Exosome component EXOSC1/CSL4 [Ceratobasidium sp. AG-Ba]
MSNILLPGQPIVGTPATAHTHGMAWLARRCLGSRTEARSRRRRQAGPKHRRRVRSSSGTVTRLSPLQATISITIVDSVPLPHGEEFTGVIRVQDVRSTEKDKVKISDCFRGGDVVRGAVVSPFDISPVPEYD